MKKVILAALACFAVLSCNKAAKEIEPIVKDEITVTPKISTIGIEGGTAKVIVSSSGEWTMKGKADYSSWITPSAVKGKDGAIVSFVVKPNSENDNKVAEWEFTCGSAKDVFTVTSLGLSAKPEHLKLVDKNEIELNEKGGRLSLKFETSLGYRSLKNAIKGGEGWLKYGTTIESEGGATMYFTYGVLEGLKDRNAEITISAERVEPVVVKVTQLAKRVLVPEQKFFKAPIDGGDLIVPMAVNVEYEVNIAEAGKSWITLGEKKDGKVIFKIGKLTDGKRSADVTFKQTNAKEGVKPLEAKITITQMSTLISWAANMRGSRLFPKWDGKNGYLGSQENFTLECLVRFDDFSKSSGQIYTIMGVEGKYLLRMGDVGNSLDHLQIATANGNYNVPFKFEAKRWYHIAVTYAKGKVVAYVDGKNVGSCRFRLGYSYPNLSPDWSYEPFGDRCFWVGYSYETNRDTYGQMTEVRIWKKALTEAEINAKNHFYTVDPKSEGLFSYWKFTEGKGNFIEDATDNGNKLYGEVDIQKYGGVNRGNPGIKWVEVSLPEK